MGKIKSENKFYVYVYLDPRKPGKYIYGEYSFYYEPFYVGKGHDKRSGDHITEAKNILNKEMKINKKNFPEINLYKINKILKIIRENSDIPIILKIEENLLEKYSFKLEKKCIKTIGRHDLKKGPLTNLTDGGEGTSGILVSEETRLKHSTSVLQFDLNGQLIKEWKNIKTVTKKFNLSKTSLQHIIKKNIRIHNNNIWFYKKEFKDKQIPQLLNIELIKELIKNKENQYGRKKIIQFSKDGTLIKEWSSIKEASIATGITENQISRVCSGVVNYKTAGGFIWKYYYNEPNITLLNIVTGKKRVIQYDMQMNKINEFESIQCAMNKTNVMRCSISKVCSGNRNKAGGFIWKYAEN